MMNVKMDRAVWLILIISVGLYLSIPFLSLVFGCEDKDEAKVLEPADNWIEAVERWPDAPGYVTDNFGKTLPLDTNIEVSDPNEPETTSSWIYIADLNEPKKVSLDFIPTWPDYIELEKDLVFDNTHRNDPNKPWILWVSKTISKGTKIYFKDN